MPGDAVTKNSITSNMYISGGGANNVILYNNGTAYTTTASGRTQASGPNYIGVGQYGSTGNYQMYYFYIFNSALSNSDRAIIEST
jgi:hypothetical protein